MSSTNLHVLVKNDNFQKRVKNALLDLALTISQEEKPLLFSSTWKARNQLAKSVLQNKIDVQFYTEILLSNSTNLVKASGNMSDPGIGLTDAEIRTWFSNQWTTLGLNDDLSDEEGV